VSYSEAIILGILQGLTEFLPVSSSGHLVLAQELFRANPPGLAFELLVHLGTLLAVLVYFRSRLVAMFRSLYTRELDRERRWILLLIIGTIPAGLAGVLWEDVFEAAFGDPLITSIMLVITGLILLSTRWVRTGEGEPGWWSTIAMGCGQALAIMPGISRSGSTIAAGMLAGIKPSEAAEFSFLLAIPAITGAVVFKLRALIDLDPDLTGQYFVGTLFSFLFGLVAVYAVLATVRRGRFEYFAYYCFAVGALGLYLFA
jgi:undecaprenyl-diphosphatase